MITGAKISKLRKEKNFTQEALANFAGVSVAAVSKWETGASLPDITLLPAIAEFFDVSVDCLLGYRYDAGGAYSAVAEKLDEFQRTGNYGDGIPFCEKALEKFPNDFALLNTLGLLYSYRAWEKGTPDRGETLRAIAYWERAKPFITDMDPESLDQSIALSWDSIGETRKALSILSGLKSDMFNADMARLYIKLGEYGEAKKRVNQLFNILICQSLQQALHLMAEIYLHEDDMKMARKALETGAVFYKQLCFEDRASYFDPVAADFFEKAAELYPEPNDVEKKASLLAEVKRHAERHSASPTDDMADAYFFEGSFGYRSGSHYRERCTAEERTF